MIYIKSEKEISKIEQANRIVAETLQFLEKMIEPGVTTAVLDREAENYILSKKARPSFKGLYGFPAAACISVNDEVVHGIPGKRRLQSGDIVGVDIGVEWEGFYGDAARTFAVGEVNSITRRLCQVTEESLALGIAQCQADKRVGDISAAIQEHVEAHNFSVVRDLVGHGVGVKPHEDPQIPNYGSRGKGPRLRVGMVLAIEPMVNMGQYQVYIDEDEWTVKTVDGKPSAHYEHSVAIMAGGPRILSQVS